MTRENSWPPRPNFEDSSDEEASPLFSSGNSTHLPPLELGIDSSSWHSTNMTGNVDRYHKKLKKLHEQGLDRFVSDRRAVIPGRHGKDVVIPFDPDIAIPQYQLDHSKGGGVGQGQGNPGDVIGRGDGKGGQNGPAGTEPGEHGYGIGIDEILEMMFDEIDLRRIQPRDGGATETIVEGGKFRPKSPTRSPEFLFKKSFLKGIQVGYSPEEAVQHVRESGIAQYGVWKEEEKEVPSSRVVIIFMLDYSGSVTNAIKEKVRQIAFWMTQMLKKQYAHVDVEYIVHDTTAKSVDEQQFYTLTAGGGTTISSALRLCMETAQKKYPPNQFDVYPVQLTDGENQFGDNDVCMQLIKQMLTPGATPGHSLALARYYSLFQVNDKAPTTGAGQMAYYGSDQTSYFKAVGELAKELNKPDVDGEVIGLAQIHQNEGPNGIWTGIKEVLGKPKERKKGKK